MRKKTAILLAVFMAIASLATVFANVPDGAVYNAKLSEYWTEKISITVSDMFVAPADDLNESTADNYAWLTAISKKFSVDITDVSVSVYEMPNNTDTTDFSNAPNCIHDYTYVMELGPITITSQGSCSIHNNCWVAHYRQTVLLHCYVCGNSFYSYPVWSTHTSF